ncbi:ABC transporter ATP-binding protein [Patiriisocius marinistellae]|uniref:ABC transporter ATP-binding protein n=1 Tax=Patiriisocius marinistellae TaxID=2494560 RepID=A0A5J4G0C5_9FLAO|nr:ATP-binding cassette domain-containing protein [Patiriisocius marinistellae]GEQ85929.1 ABC transporter ATP-binding protein [Patiriisocius marinistellae]
MATLVLHHVSKSFKKKEVLKDVSFQIETGDILGLFGRNGSGKSTLLKLLFGNMKADSIKVSMNSNEIKISEVIPKQFISYLPQDPFLPAHAKVRDIIPMFHSGEAEQDRIFYDPQIATMTNKSMKDLSHGERKYFEVVLMSYLPHPFLMLDEPFSMLEPLHKERLKLFLTSVSKLKGIIITDHYYNDVLEISSQNLVIKDGKGHLIKTTEDLKKLNYIL